MAFLSILTTVYNRRELMERLFLSLQRQTDKRFEWVIADDGSTDGIEEAVDGMKSRADGFEILFLKKENGGKHTALNYAYPYLKGDHTLIIDSDDYLVDDAVESIYRMIEEIGDDESFAGIAGDRGSAPGGENAGYVDCTSLERPKHRIFGDKAEVFRTDILRRYPFPVFEGEKMIPESVVWSRIALDGYRLRWYSKVLVILEYLPDGLTKQGMKNRCMKNIHGYLRDCAITGKHEGFPYGIIYRGFVFRVARKLGLTYKDIEKEADTSFAVIIAALCVNALMNIYRKVKKRKEIL